MFSTLLENDGHFQSLKSFSVLVFGHTIMCKKYTNIIIIIYSIKPELYNMNWTQSFSTLHVFALLEGFFKNTSIYDLYI